MRSNMLKPYILPLLLAALWCLLLMALLQRSMRNEEKHAMDLARLQVGTLCAQMLDIRAWNAAHGGVYVRESEYGAPNPWIPEKIRHATLAGGERLVLVNPAYMSRQIAERSARGARLRITSNKPLRPENRADEWEEAALRSISLGEQEIFKLETSESGLQNFRYMAPLPAEADCLRCHENNRLHDVRGGISITLEAAPFLQSIQDYNETLGYTYALMGFAGMLGIGGLSFAINRKRMLAEHKEQMNSAFLANMSHDMRTPLTGIMGMADLLQKEQGDAKKHQACRYLHSATAALLDMVTDITTHAALDAGRLRCAHREFNVREEIERCLDLFRPACAEKGLKLEFAPADALAPVLVGDAFRIRQALGNLTGNAVKFTERGSIRVEADGENLDEGDYMLLLKVRDTGPGIAAADQTRIFERFVQGAWGQEHNTPGTGLGLAITRELAGLMRGSLSLESVYGKGSCFTLRLHCALPKPGTVRTKRVSQESSSPLTTPAKALRIVLAEDNKAGAWFLQEILKEAGHSVAVAENGLDALALLRNSPADLAILDVRMPGMGGLELAERIRKGGAGVDPELPIISITASQSEDLKERFAKLGVFFQAEKPLKAEYILRLAQMACARAGQGAETEAETVFDPDAALENMDGKPALLRKLAAILLDEMPRQVQTLAQALEQGDPACALHLAHALKNSAGMLRLRQLETASCALEKTINARQDCRHDWPALQRAAEKAQDALRSWMDKQMDGS